MIGITPTKENLAMFKQEAELLSIKADGAFEAYRSYARMYMNNVLGNSGLKAGDWIMSKDGKMYVIDSVGLHYGTYSPIVNCKSVLKSGKVGKSLDYVLSESAILASKKVVR